MTINFLNDIVPFAKDLGMTLDSYLTYDQHITNLVSSCMYEFAVPNIPSQKMFR
jgi:hypothetical protein